MAKVNLRQIIREELRKVLKEGATSIRRRPSRTVVRKTSLKENKDMFNLLDGIAEDAIDFSPGFAAGNTTGEYECNFLADEGDNPDDYTLAEAEDDARTLAAAMKRLGIFKTVNVSNDKDVHGTPIWTVTANVKS